MTKRIDPSAEVPEESSPPHEWTPDPRWPTVPAGQRLQGEGSPRSRERTVGIFILAVIGGFGLLLTLVAAITVGFGGGLVFLGLAVFVMGFGAVLIGRRWWALIPSRRAGAGLLVAGLATLIVGASLVSPAASTKEGDAQSAAAVTATSTTSSITSTAAALTASQIDALIATAAPQTALATLGTLTVKDASTPAGYDRDQFGPAWTDVDMNGCDTRNDILARDLTNIQVQPGTNNCVVLSGQLDDPYTAATLTFAQDQANSGTVDIDHVVALADAWGTGAQAWDAPSRQKFANDPFDLLAVDGPTNAAKSEANAATWLPPDTAYRCQYVARQIAVKAKYQLGVTNTERTATAGVLSSCPTQTLPVDTAAVKAAAAQAAQQSAAAAAAEAAQQSAAAAAAEAAQQSAASASAQAAQQPAPAETEQAPVPASPGPTALCVDGTLSYAAHHQGACSHHGGVATFYK